MNDSTTRTFVTDYKLGSVWIDGTDIVWTRKGEEKRLPLARADVRRVMGMYYIRAIDGSDWSNGDVLARVTDEAALRSMAERYQLFGARDRYKAGEKAAAARFAETRPQLEGMSSGVAAAPRAQVKVKTYKNAKEYQHDAPRMARDGWMPQGQTQSNQKVAIGKTARHVAMTGGLGLLVGGRAHKDGKLIITWVR